MRNVSMIIWAVVMVLLVAGASRADLTGYVACYNDSELVYFTNFDTGEQTALGRSGIIEEIRAMDLSPIDGRLFASGNNYLWTIDTTSGVGRRIGTAGSRIDNLAFAPDSTLYGITTGTAAHLVTIDTVTGNTTTIGSTLPYTTIDAFGIDESGRGIAWWWNSANTSESTLLGIDLTDGSTSLIGYLRAGFSAFDYGPDGTLYGWCASGMGGEYYDYFCRIDVENLEAVHLRTFQNGWSQFAIIPEPATLLLFGLGGLALLRRRRA